MIGAHAVTQLQSTERRADLDRSSIKVFSKSWLVADWAPAKTRVKSIDCDG
jgi:hypothetical protein